MESWECIEKVTGYIEENLSQVLCRFYSRYKMEAPEVDPLSEVWNKLHDVKRSIKTLKAEGCEIGISTSMGNGNEFTYYAGAETTEPTSIDGRIVAP